MELKTCEYCGTAYDARLSQCPLCGRTAGGQKAPAQPEPKRVRPAAENKPHDRQRLRRIFRCRRCPLYLRLCAVMP